MLLSEFDYDLPLELIAQVPARLREESRLLVLDRRSGSVAHRSFGDFPSLLAPGDLLVLNESRVIPARLRLAKQGTGGKAEVLLLRQSGGGKWEALVKPSARFREGMELERPDSPGRAVLRLEKRSGGGKWLVSLPDGGVEGETPLPPYIHRDGDPALRALDRERYQTVFARVPGSVAAPTAGLHFTDGTLARAGQAGAGIARCILHIGLGTFGPVADGEVEKHRMEPESYEIDARNAAKVREAHAAGKRIVAVGTSSVRVLETMAPSLGAAAGGASGETALFISPGFQFRLTGAMLTNFHLPKSTPYILVAALAGLDLIRKAYAEAIREKYRFLSYGDAMLII